MILLEAEDHRVIRTDLQGNKWEYSDKISQPAGEGWARVNKLKHPRATKYLWVRPYSASIKSTSTKKAPISMSGMADIKLAPIDSNMMAKLSVSIHNVISDFRQKARNGLLSNQPYYAGDRVTYGGKVHYVTRVDKRANKVYLKSPLSNKGEIVADPNQLQKAFTHKDAFWDIKDNVVLSPDAAGSKGADHGEVIGFDSSTNKVRILIAGGKEVEVYPEAIVGLKGANADALEKAEKYLDKNPNVLSDADSKAVIEAVLRASLQNRATVGVEELWEDLKCTTGKNFSKRILRNTLSDMEVALGSDKYRGFKFNILTDEAYIADARLNIRLLANKRGIKSSHKLFGWKNITTNEGNEEYAHSGQLVRFKKGDTDNYFKIKRIKGNTAEITLDGNTKTVHLGELESASGKNLLPDPLDPQAYGAINRNAFFLLKDREWCKDFKKNDIVSFLSTVEDPSGKKAQMGMFGKIMGHTTDGRVIAELEGTKKQVYVSPRQLKQVATVKNSNQFLQRVESNTSRMYGSTTKISNMARISVGGQHKKQFLQLNFINGATYKENEAQLFSLIEDNKATQNRQKGIVTANPNATPDDLSKTLVPNKDIMDAIRRLYPNARTFMITRQMRYLPNRGKKFLTPNTPEQQNALTADERKELIKKNKGPDYIDPHNVIKKANNATKGDRSYFEPEGYAEDLDTGELSLKGGEPADVFSPLYKFKALSPFNSVHHVNRLRSYSGAKVEGDYNYVPVSVKITINPSSKEIRSHLNAVVHDVPYVMRQYSNWKDVSNRPSEAVKTEDVDWNNNLKLSITGNRIYLDVGKGAGNLISSEFTDSTGRNLTLFNLLQMPQEKKYELWSNRKDFNKFLQLTSLFTYDRATKRYMTSIHNYELVHKFLKKFFGENGFAARVYEDYDGAFSMSASKRVLFPQYHASITKEQDRYIKNATEEGSSTSGNAMEDIRKGFNYSPFLSPGREYQPRTLNFLLSRNASLLANDQGTGKTPLILAAIKGRMNRGEVKKALVIAPASVAQNNWPSEIEKWCKNGADVDRIKASKMSPQKKAEKIAALPLSVTPMVLNSKTREKFFKEVMEKDSGVIATCGYEMARIYGKELQKLGFDMVCLDEAQGIKTGKSHGIQGSKQAEMIKEVFGDTKYKIAASGTPLENKAQDLHSIISWLDPELFGSAEDFMADYVVTDFIDINGKKRMVNVAIKNAEELDNRLSGIMIRTSKKWMEQGEQEAIKKELESKGVKFNALLHYGQVTPRLVYPLVAPRIDLDTGKIMYQRMDGEVTPFVKDLMNNGPDEQNLLTPIDLTSPSIKEKYKDYTNIVNEVNRRVAAEMKHMILKKTRYGSINSAATTAFTKMQKALNAPELLRSDPEFADLVPLNGPKIANPKYDRLVAILKEHDKRPYNPRIKTLMGDPIEKPDLRKKALETRGKKIIFCESVQVMKALKKKMEEDPQFRGRIAVYAGTSKTGEISGKEGSGKKLRAESLRAMQEDINTDILLANSAAETGLNIPQADLVVNYELPWNPQKLDQRIDRAHRVGSQPRPVTAVNIFVANSIEEKKVRAHVVKKQLFNSIMSRRERAQEISRLGKTVLPMDEANKLSPEYLRKSVAFMGDDKSQLMSEMLRTDDSMKDINAASMLDMERSMKLRRLKKAAARNKKKRVNYQRKYNIIGKLLNYI